MARLRVHWFQHVAFEDLGSIAPWLESQGAEVSGTAFWRGEEAPPSAEGFDGLIIMGGPMSVKDEAEHPWLSGEKALIREAIAQGKVVLGICLGAQLIAEVLGGHVFRNAEREIGWFPLEHTPEGGTHPLGRLLPRAEEVFHWHGETFSLPEGAAWLARSAACQHQAFAVGDRILALQCHLESTPASVKAMLENGGDDLAPGRFVQSAEKITEGTRHCGSLNDALERLLAALPWPRSLGSP